MALVEVKVPDIGDFDEVAVIELMVKVGDTVKVEQSLITVESDKASMEIPSSTAGVVKEIKVALGDKVKEGSVVVMVEAAGAAAEPKTAPAPAASAPAAPVSVAAASVAAPAVAVAAPAASSPVEVRVPDIGDFKDVAVIELLVKVGDTVKVEQSLITVESDKASMEIPSSTAGVVKEIKVKLGDTVNIGDLVVILEGVAGAAAAPAAAPAAVAAAPAAPAAAPAPVAAAAAPAAVAVPAHAPGGTTLGLPHASPSVRKFARELGVPLNEVKGSGLKGRITEADVQGFTRSVMSGAVQTLAIAAQAKASGSNDGAGLGLIPWPKVDFAKFGPIERKEMSRIKKISGANLLRNAVMIPAVTNHDDADITDLEAFRVSTNKENEKSGIKVTMLAFLIKACVAALKKFPEFNSSLDGDALIYKQYYHIGFAADTPNGLVVPVIKDADKKGIFQISQEMGELAKKARDGKLGPADMSGATFTISSLGGIGGRYFTPIINAPEVAILGVCKSQMEPVWDGKAFQPRLMLPLSLTWDHRVIDGAAAARFNVYLGQILGDFRRVLL
ncbi:Dihydrolipoyllysine-residue acetyltransferase component of pyruvate dehydrogenase complex [Curvibacter sp. AEP1-3]|uniref:dihydrolipoyllysine-residue acetyltransferase n=1 Tax=Curvibacter sp. AEP1-3 TaxID=1844971 RepID=UPI000B3C1B0D|nr:dihydrolipoyllysine-residue acetyltransferase [Curvibacter sp. AEP1-3]ARV17115.1 Dihydrolipoyllysine-residue acetyltransferase component of pyruvate dehydrogenase complex [Curvibacter sp. AEP1-3]